MELGRFGVWTSYRSLGEQNAARAAEVAENLGYGTFWLGGSPRLSSVAPLLEASERLTVATSIVNVWQYEPAELCAEYTALEAAHPGRLIVGIGIGHPEATQAYEKPLAKMRGFLDGIRTARTPIPTDQLIVAALGPKMLDLAAERTLGTIPYFVPTAHTAAARDRIGPDRIVAPELAVVLDTDAERARATARGYAEMYLGLANYTGNLRRYGYSDADIADGGSDRLIDEIVPQGSADELASHLQAHLDAGADHVCVQTVGVPGVPEAQWRDLAVALGLSGAA